MTWGVWGKNFDQNQMINTIHHCLDLGITTFDHADIYGDYTTEGEWGSAFAKANVSRDRIKIISKCGIQMKGDARPENYVKHYNYDKKYIISSAERSLKELKTDYLDLFLLHRPSPLMHPEEIHDAVEDLQKSGKIRDFGVSNFTNSQIDLIQSRTRVVANQIEISLNATDSLVDGTLDDAIVNDIIPMSWSPLGTYFKEETPQNLRIKKKIEELSEKYNATDDQLLLAWLLKHPSGIHPVIGTTNTSRITNAVKALDIDLALQDWFELLEVSMGRRVA